MDNQQSFEDKVMEEALDRFGFDDQVRQLAEECSELCLAALKFLRSSTHGSVARIKASKMDLAEEMADVSLMVRQIAEFGGEDVKSTFERCRDFKLKRLAERLQITQGEADVEEEA